MTDERRAPARIGGAHSKGRNIVICLDGTANEFKLRSNTNVVKLYSLLVRDPNLQIAYYHPGVGTMAPPGALTGITRAITRLIGMAFGYGLFSDIRDAYVYLMNHYRPGDRIFIFGFSRGAYAARALAALIHMYGLFGRGNEALVPYAIRMMKKINDAETRADKNRFFDAARDFRDIFSDRSCTIAFVGLWDTVSSVGWIENPLHLAYTADNPSIEVGRHAVAIDERRAFFRTNLWRPASPPPSGPKEMKQVWFAGVHCDVGGGYAEGESGLSAIAFDWMLREAEAPGVGLLVDPERRRRFCGGVYAKPNPGAEAHVSLTPLWWLAEFLLKRHWNWKKRSWTMRANLFRRRTIPDGSTIHRSVEQRGAEYCRRLPPEHVFVD
jgi:uncharacterized protein (DUF2235 family)